MITSAARRLRSFVPTTALAESVDFSDEEMHVHLSDGRTVSVPLIWFPSLHAASPEERSGYRIRVGGKALHWPEIDEDLTVAGLLAGGDQQAA